MLPQLQVERQILGTDRSYPIKIKNARGEPVTSYKVDNPLSAKLWPGDNLPTLATPAVSWRNPGQATARLDVTAEDTLAAGEPGRFQVMCFVGESGGKTKPFFHFYLDLIASPGAGVGGKVYGTFDQMMVYYSPIIDLPATSTDQSNFAEQRSAARRWIDTWIEDHVPTSSRAAIRAKLANDELVITGKVAEIAAKKAIAIVLGNQVTQDQAAVAAGRKSAFEPDRKRFDDDANTLIASLIAEFQDGTTLDIRVGPGGLPLVMSSPTLGYGVLRGGPWGGRRGGYCGGDY